MERNLEFMMYTLIVNSVLFIGLIAIYPTVGYILLVMCALALLHLLSEMY